MSTFLVLRELDHTLTGIERDVMTLRLVTALAQNPGVDWLRSYVIDRPGRFESFCVFRGPSAKAVALRSVYCKIPFREVRPVTEHVPLPAAPLTDDHSLYVTRHRLPGGDDDGFGRFNSGDPAAQPIVRWVCSLRDRERQEVHSVFSSPDEATLVQSSERCGVAFELVEEVVEANSSAWRSQFVDAGGPPTRPEDGF